MVSKKEIDYHYHIMQEVKGANGTYIEFSNFRKHIAEKIKLAQYLRGKVLDLGCGRGQSTLPLYELGAKEILGIDVQETNLKYWRDNFCGEAIQAYLPHLPLRNCSIDAVCASYLFDLVYDVRAGLEEVKRILKPGGILYIVVQVNKVSGLESPFGGMGEAIASYLYLPEFIRGRNLYHYEPTAQFKLLLSQSGFKLLRKYRWRNHLAFLAQKVS